MELIKWQTFFYMPCHRLPCAKILIAVKFPLMVTLRSSIADDSLCHAAMQEEALKLVLLALEDGSALSRKVLVLFVVQRLEPRFPQASKTSIGHVVQLLYRASCFKVRSTPERLLCSVSSNGRSKLPQVACSQHSGAFCQSYLPPPVQKVTINRAAL